MSSLAPTATDHCAMVLAADPRVAVARRIVNAYVVGNMAGTVIQIPVPLLDLAVSAGFQLAMLHALADTFGVPFEKTWVVASLGSLISSAVPSAAAHLVAGSLMRVIPVGAVINFGVQAGLIGASTYALGQVFIQHFSRGGTFRDFAQRGADAHYARHFADGERVAATVRVGLA